MSIQVLQPGASFARPADTVAYAVGDLVANSTTAGSVVPLPFALGEQGLSAMLRRFKLRKTSAGLTNAQFRIHLFRTSPVLTVGDNAAIVLPGDGSNYLGNADVTIDQAFATGAVGYGAFSVDNYFRASPNDPEFIFALLEARAAYTPVSGETFELVLQLRAG